MVKSLNKKMKKASFSFIALLLVLMNFLIHLPSKAEAATTELKGLGDATYYNAIIFGDHSATSADIEGAMAVQGNMNASSYTVTAAATGAFNLAGAKWNDEGYPSLLLGREFTKAGEGKVIIQDGTVVMTKEGDPTGSLTSSYGRVSYKEKSEIDAKFKEFRKDIDGVIEETSQFHTNNPKQNMSFGIGEDVNNPNIYVSSTLTGKQKQDIDSVFLPNVNNKDFIVIYSDATEVNFANGAIFYDTNDIGTATEMINTSQAYDPNSHFTELASKVIWVFPKATKISTKGYGIVGSVFAPNAVVETKGGSINGQVYLGGLHQRDGFEVHNFQLNWSKWKKKTPKREQLKIKKVDASNKNIVLKGAVFEVVNKDNEVVATVTTDDNGIAEVKDLPLGDYVVKEKEAPEGYKLSNKEWKVTLQKEQDIVTVEVENEKETEKPGEPGEETEKPGESGEETEKPGESGEETEKPGESGEETEKPGEPGEETEKPGEPGEETEKPGEPGEETEKPGEPGEETEKPGESGEETEKPGELGEETEKPGKLGEGTEKPGEPGEETEKPGESGEETEKPGELGEETEKPGKLGEGTEKPGEPGEEREESSNLEETGTSLEGNVDKSKSSIGQDSNGEKKLPATGHSMNWLSLLGGMLILLGIRLNVIAKKG